MSPLVLLGFVFVTVKWNPVEIEKGDLFVSVAEELSAKQSITVIVLFDESNDCSCTSSGCCVRAGRCNDVTLLASHDLMCVPDIDWDAAPMGHISVVVVIDGMASRPTLVGIYLPARTPSKPMYENSIVIGIIALFGTSIVLISIILGIKIRYCRVSQPFVV